MVEVYYSGTPMSIADMNGDNLDDIITMNNASQLLIHYQTTPNAEFGVLFIGDLSGSSREWSLTIADVDNNGYNDVFSGGQYNPLKIVKANSDGTAYSEVVLANAYASNIFLQSAAFADIDMDGNIDLFPCHDVGLSPPYKGDGTGNFVYNAGLIDTTTDPPSDNSGNYGATFVDYDNDGDLDMYLARCRQGVNVPTDPRRINMLLENDGSGNYTDVAEARGLRPLKQTWSAEFGDVDNDGDWDCFLLNHDGGSDLYLCNPNPPAGEDMYEKIALAESLEDDLGSLFGIQNIFRDFDNDGFLDLLVTGFNDSHVLFMNDGDGTFTANNTAIPALHSGRPIQTAAAGDLNNDGKVDIFAGYASSINSPQSSFPDKLLMNTSTNSNNYFKVLLTGPDGNKNGIGAKLELYGDWGKQIREVRSGESYSITNSFTQHFGLGTASTIEQLIVRWPSGTVDVVCDPSINGTLFLTEGDSPATESCVALPLELIDFSGEALSNYNEIQWTTANEKRLAYFELESADEKAQFEPVEKIAAVNTYARRVYSITDSEPFTNSFYRLKIVNEDGSFEYSEMIELSRKEKVNDIAVFPNPGLEGGFNMQFFQPKDGNVQWTLLDLNGKVILERRLVATKGENNYFLEMNDSGQGIYILNFKSDYLNKSQKVVYR